MRTGRNYLLDFVRGGAALEVMLAHLRAFIFADYGNLHGAGALLQVFYYATGFGHQAVVIFFVLSGYLVGGSVLSAKPDGFWTRYGVQRLSRLWIVLLPCLAMTVLWNCLGMYTGGTPFLTGRMHLEVNSGPNGEGLQLGVMTFLGNAFFLQTIATPVLGDNGPLWSLANEFWYYVLFPLMVFGFRRQADWRRPLVFLTGAGLLLALLPFGIVSGYVIWLAGAAVFACAGTRFSRFLALFPVGIAAVLVCAGLFHCSRFGHVSDVVLGISFSTTLPFLFRLPALPQVVARSAAWLSDFSYTLYLAHFPFAAFIWYTWLDAKRATPSLLTFGQYAGVALVLIGYSYLLSLLFERNTDKLRRAVMRLFAVETTGRNSPVAK